MLHWLNHMILPLCVKKGSQQGEVSWLMIIKGKTSVGRLSIFGTWNQWVNVGYMFPPWATDLKNQRTHPCLKVLNYHRTSFNPYLVSEKSKIHVKKPTWSCWFFQENWQVFWKISEPRNQRFFSFWTYKEAKPEVLWSIGFLKPWARGFWKNQRTIQQLWRKSHTRLQQNKTKQEKVELWAHTNSFLIKLKARDIDFIWIRFGFLFTMCRSMRYWLMQIYYMYAVKSPVCNLNKQINILDNANSIPLM